MTLRKHIAVLAFSLIAAASGFCSDSDICGKYVIQNAVDDYQGTRYFEISRNRYQEYEVEAENSFRSVAYFDGENQELFCVIAPAHQYNTLMKFRIQAGSLKVYSLNNQKWTEYPGEYRKESSGAPGIQNQGN